MKTGKEIGGRSYVLISTWAILILDSPPQVWESFFIVGGALIIKENGFVGSQCPLWAFESCASLNVPVELPTFESVVPWAKTDWCLGSDKSHPES